MDLRKGDKVIVIAGRDKGKSGVIQKVIPETNRVVVEGINVRKKHQKPTQASLKSMLQSTPATLCLKTQKLKNQPELVIKKSRVKKSASLRRAEQCYKEV